MKSKLFIYLAMCILLVLAAIPVMGTTTTIELIAAKDMPPGSMENGSDGHGYGVEIFQAICKRAGFEPKVTYLPWPRAQVTVSKGNNLVIMGISRAPEREKNYDWICLGYNIEWAFASINGKSYSIDSAKSLNSVLIQSGVPAISVLTKAGYTNLSEVPENVMNAKKLAAGRGDAWATPITAGKWIWKKEGFSVPLTFGPTFLKGEMWMAMSPGSDPAIENALKKGYEAIKADGTFKAIFSKYGN